MRELESVLKHREDLIRSLEGTVAQKESDLSFLLKEKFRLSKDIIASRSTARAHHIGSQGASGGSTENCSVNPGHCKAGGCKLEGLSATVKNGDFEVTQEGEASQKGPHKESNTQKQQSSSQNAVDPHDSKDCESFNKVDMGVPTYADSSPVKDPALALCRERRDSFLDVQELLKDQKGASLSFGAGWAEGPDHLRKHVPSASKGSSGKGVCELAITPAVLCAEASKCASPSLQAARRVNEPPSSYPSNRLQADAMEEQDLNEPQPNTKPKTAIGVGDILRQAAPEKCRQREGTTSCPFSRITESTRRLFNGETKAEKLNECSSSQTGATCKTDSSSDANVSKVLSRTTRLKEMIRQLSGNETLRVCLRVQFQAELFFKAFLVSPS